LIFFIAVQTNLFNTGASILGDWGCRDSQIDLWAGVVGVVKYYDVGPTGSMFQRGDF